MYGGRRSFFDVTWRVKMTAVASKGRLPIARPYVFATLNTSPFYLRFHLSSSRFSRQGQNKLHR